MAEFQRRSGPAVTVVTVHQDPNEGPVCSASPNSACACPPSRTPTAGSRLPCTYPMSCPRRWYCARTVA